MPLAEQCGRGSQQAVATTDAVVEEGEGPSRGHGGHPEADLAQLDRHLVDVDTVEAVADDVPQGERDLSGGRLFIATAYRGQPARDAVGGRDQEVTRADRQVTDLETENGLFRIGLGGRPVEQRVESAVQRFLDQGLVGVVAAGGLALASPDRFEREGRGLAVQIRVQLQQGLVDAAKLLRAQVAVIDRAQAALLLDEGQGANGFEEVAVADARAGEVRELRRVPEEAAEGWQGQCGTTVRVELGHDHLEALEEVLVAAALEPVGDAAEPGGGVVVQVALPRRSCRRW